MLNEWEEVWVTTSLEVRQGEPPFGSETPTLCEPRRQDVQDDKTQTSAKNDVATSSRGSYPGQRYGWDAYADPEGKVFYRLTPRVWGWVSRTMRTAEASVESGRVTHEALSAAKEVCQSLQKWARARYGDFALKAAERKKEPLPDTDISDPAGYRFPAGGAPTPARAAYSPPVATLTTPDEDAELARLSEWFLRLPCPAGGGGQGEGMEVTPPIRLGPHRVIADPALWWAYHRRRLAGGLSRGQVRRGLLDGLRALRRTMGATGC